MIKLIRIDDRLLHGQVALTWVPALGIDCLVISNDKVAKDEFQKMTLGLAKPANTKLFIKSVSDTIVFLNDEKFRSLKILLLVNSVKDAADISAQVSDITSINFGGLRQREGAKQISKAIAVTEEDVSIIRTLENKAIELEIRQVPTDKKIMVQELINH